MLLFTGKTFASLLENLILKFPRANFFFDEAPIGGLDGINLADLMALAKKLSPQNHFWIASSHNSPIEGDHKSGD